MNHDQIVKAIKFIRPGAEFVLRGDVLEWLDAEQIEPTKAEIEKAFVQYEAKVEADKIAAQAQKAAILEKLGLTEEEAKVLLGKAF